MFIMKSFMAFLVLTLLAGGLTSASAADYQKAQSKVYRLRLRAAPTVTAPVVGYLSKSETVSIIDKSTFTASVAEKRDYWFQVLNSTGTKGWVFGSYLYFPPETK